MEKLFRICERLRYFLLKRELKKDIINKINAKIEENEMIQFVIVLLYILILSTLLYFSLDKLLSNIALVIFLTSFASLTYSVMFLYLFLGKTKTLKYP